MIHNDSLRFLAATWLLTASASLPLRQEQDFTAHEPPCPKMARPAREWRNRQSKAAPQPNPGASTVVLKPLNLTAADLCTAIFSKVYFWIDSFEYIFVSDTSLRMNCTGTSPAPKRMKDAQGNPVPTHVLSEEIPISDIEVGSDLTKCLPIDVLISILFCFHSPDYVRTFSVLSKSHLRTCLRAMKEMCRQRWRTKANFHARWAHAISNSMDGSQFWYRQYFHEESKVGIPKEELTRLTFSCQFRSLVQSFGPHVISYRINFNDTTAKYIRDNPTRTEKDEGRVEVNGRMVGHPIFCRDKALRGSHIQCSSIDWFLYQGGTVIKLGMPLLKPHPGRPKFDENSIFHVKRDDSWRWTLTSNKEIMRSND